LEGLFQDVRHGVRVSVKNPGFTAIAVMSIAFGTGANVAIFSLADALLLRPLPVLRPSEILVVGTKVPRGLASMDAMSYPDYIDTRERTRTFEDLVAFVYENAAFTAEPGAIPQVKLATLVSGNFFRVLGVEPEIGRAFVPEEDRIGGRNTVTVLSYGMWQQTFFGDPSVLGRKILIAGIEFTIVGVAPERFTGLHPFVREGAFVPLAMWPKFIGSEHADPLGARDFRGISVKGRLRPGISLAEARAELTLIGADLERAYPLTNTNQSPGVQTELQERFERRPLDSRLLVVLTILSIAVLCVACANVAGLLASRAPARAREIALRLAVGAGRARLVRQLITESLGIALAGGLGGLAIGYVGIVMLRQIQLPTEVVGGPQILLDRRALTFSLIAAVSCAFLFGLGPAIQTTRVNLVNSLKTTDTSNEKRRRLHGRHALVALQVALSLVLLTVAGFSYQVFRRALVDGPGFRTTQIAKITLDPGQARYDDESTIAFFERVVGEVGRMPGVQRAAVTSAIPLFSFAPVQIAPEGYQLQAGQIGAQTFSNVVDEHYFETLDIPVLAGRGFTSADTADTTGVAIVNETLANHFWPGKDPIGKRFRVPRDAANPGPWVEIVGVAKTTAYLYIAENPQDMVYFPYRQRAHNSMVVLARTTGDSASLVAPLRATMRRIDADVPAYDAQTMEAFYAARATTIATVLMRLIGGMGIMGLTLTMVGLYGLVSYAASRRTREIGIRIAIGATYYRVLRMVLRQGLAPALIGLAAGLVLSAVTMQILPRVTLISARNDPRSYFVVVPLLLAVALVASYVPARRAARVDPTIALRCD
jgi:macrolide transport system ATP-binding/permease protein